VRTHIAGGIPEEHIAALYENVPAFDGQRHAERVLMVGQGLLSGFPCDPEVLASACLLHGVAPPGASPIGAMSATIASAYLRGAGHADRHVGAVYSAIQGTDWTGRGEEGRPSTDEGVILWHADRLDILNLERHADFLAESPTASGRQGRLSYRERDAHLASYQKRFVAEALALRPRLWLPGCADLFDEMFASLEVFLDDLVKGRLDRLPARVRHLIEGMPPKKRQVLSPQWRRLAEVSRIREGVERLFRGEDPKAVKEGMPSRGLPFDQFRAEQREVILSSHDQILELAHRRIVAAQVVAAEKYLEGDTVHKPEVEEGLFVGARERGRQIGLEPSIAEDIARLLLSKAREIQEKTQNQIAARLSRLHGEVMDADTPGLPGELDTSIPALVVRLGDQPLARESELIKEYRLTGMTEAYPLQRQAYLRWFEQPHHMATKGLIVASRDNDSFVQALLSGERCKVVASSVANRKMHVGDTGLISLLGYYQRLGADLVISFSDFDSVPSEIAGSKSKDVGGVISRLRVEAREAAYHRLLDFAAIGVNLESLDAYFESSRQDVLELALELGSKISLGDLNSALGLRMNDSTASTLLPLLKVASILHVQTMTYGGSCWTQVVCGLDRDVYVRMARKVADHFGFRRPSALYVRMAKALDVYENPGTGSQVDVMDVLIPRNALLLEDDADKTRRKISRALTGGRNTEAEQRRLGGNPDPRVCSVSSLVAFQPGVSADSHKQLMEACRSGALLCGDCKKHAVDVTVEFLEGHRVKLAGLSKSTLARARELAEAR